MLKIGQLITQLIELERLMHDTATLITQESSTPAELTAGALSGITNVIETRERIFEHANRFLRLRRHFVSSVGIPKCVLVIRFANESTHDAERIENHLHKALGAAVPIAHVGRDEYAAVLLDTNPCSEIVDRLEQALEKMRQANLSCRIGVARCPLDGDQLDHLISAASVAAGELSGHESDFQFIKRQHHLQVTAQHNASSKGALH